MAADIAGGIVRDSKGLCPTFDPYFTYIPTALWSRFRTHDKVLPRIHYFGTQTSEWHFGEAPTLPHTCLTAFMPSQDGKLILHALISNPTQMHRCPKAR